MSITAFFVDALGSALALGVATPDDVLKHVTPDALAGHLPRPLWSKLIAACLAASRVDAKLVVDTVGVPALCEHVPNGIVWGLLVEVAQRAMGKSILAPPPAVAGGRAPTSPGATVPAAMSAAPVAVPAPESASSSTSASPTSSAAPTSPLSGNTSRTFVSPPRSQTPPAGVPVAMKTPATGPVTAPATSSGDDGPPPLGAPPRTSTLLGGLGGARPSTSATPPNGSRVTGAGASTRRPQAQAAPAAPVGRAGSRTTPPPVRRPTTGADFEIDTDISSDWKKADPVAVDVDEDQLVDWAQAEETSTTGAEPRKR
jgi:hypothetical protein